MTIGIESCTFEFRDEFQRKSIAEKAISLLTSDIDVSPMVIDGSWGTGKTEFCHKLINLMKKESDNHHIIYIDAFQADHADEPLLTVLAEVLKLIPDDEQRNSVIQKIIPAVRFGLKTILKAGVSHTLRQDSTEVIDDFDEAVKQASDKAIDASVESLLKDHIEAGKNLKALQATLEEIASDKSIILFIDELDRCRPNFAVDMLETIKHTFNIPKVQFVLITNTTQLKAAINHIYGETIDAQRYLDKFLKFSFKLPHKFKENGHEKVQASVAHYRALIKQSSFLQTAELEQRAPFDLVKYIIEINQLSLREIETLVRHIEIYQQLTNKNGLENIIWGYMLLNLFGIILSCIKPELANSVVIGRADAKDIGSFLGDDKIMDFGENRFNPEVYQVLLTMLGQECYWNSDLFTPELEKTQQDWKNRIENYFDHCEPPKKLEVVVEAIEVLTLYH